MKVLEIHAAIQGEGRASGVPCVIVRFAGCPYRCAWCDTAWARDAEGEEASAAEVARRASAFGIPRFLLTGGEPLLQEELPDLIRVLIEGGGEVLVETCGALPVDRIDPRAVKIMDIKCPSSGESERVLWSNLDRLGGADEIKFVLANRADYDWAKGIVAARLGGFPGAVLFSPVHGRLPAERLAGWILEDRLLVRLHLQLHRILWPDRERGV
ncbi:MAG: radical SAM protein [Candidatus Eisenbacteria bacterium]|nr:radical SAM protein [Candidatus Eisenbacteria bacterium]